MRVEYLQHYQHHKNPEHLGGHKVASLGAEQRKSIEKNNTRPAKNASLSGSVSFSGARDKFFKAGSKAVGEKGDWVTKLVQKKGFEKLLSFTEDHPQIFSAIVTMGFIGMVKPMLVLSMPGAENDDKEQIAVKGFISALMGTALTVAICAPLSKAVKKVIANPRDYIDPRSPLCEKLEKKTSEYTKCFKDLWKQGVEIGLAPLKAAVTIAIMPGIKHIVFGKQEEERRQVKLKGVYAGIMTKGMHYDNNSEKVFGKFIQGGQA